MKPTVSSPSPRPCSRLSRLIAALVITLPLAACGPSKSELAAEIATLKEQLGQRQTEGKSLQQQASSAQTELEVARKALTEARASAESATRTLAETRTAADGDKQALNEARSALAASEKGLADTRSTLAARESRTAELERSAEQLGQKSRDLEKALEAKTVELGRVQAEVATLSSSARQAQATLEQSLARAQLEARSAAAERDSIAADLQSVRGRLASVDRELQQSSGNLEQEQKRASDLTDRLAAVIGEQSKLRQSTDAQRAELAAISAALADAQAKVARLTGARGIYTVQDGDSLSSIALFFYRNAYRWPGIAQANRHLINHPDRIFPAMVLIIPK